MKRWYEIKAQDEDSAEILIYDEIGFWGITAKDFFEDLKALGDVKELTLRINSLGGEVFDGIAIYNVLARHSANVTAIVDGIAASIASVIAMAADKIIMPENSFMMIHRAWGVVIGNAEDMEDFAETMRKFDRSILLTYLRKSNQSEEDIERMMSDETWLTAAEAKEMGFADEVSDPVKLAARANLSSFKKLPEALKAAPVQTSAPGEAADPANPNEPKPEPSPAPVQQDPSELRVQMEREAFERAQQIVSACAKAGVPSLAERFLTDKLSLDDVKARLSDAQAIRDACVAAKSPDRAAGYIAAGMSIKEVRAELFEILAVREPHINTLHGPETGFDVQPTTINPTEIYARRNNRNTARR